MIDTITKEPWHAVSIVTGATACPAALKIRGKRFLSAEAPRLALADCTFLSRCRCTYRHYPDRRSTLRRAADRGMYGKLPGLERRESTGRRAEDGSNGR